MKPSPAVLLLASSFTIAALGAAELLDDTRFAPLRTKGARAPYRPHEAIVKFEAATAFSSVMKAIQDVGGLAARRSREGSHFLVTLDPEVPVSDALARLERVPGVVYAEPNGRVYAHGAAVPETFRPNDVFFERQWHLKMLSAERTWGIQRGDSSVVVAVIDTGIAFEDHGPFRKAPDWSGTVFVPGYNVRTGDAHANDDDFHGTHVASTIAEATNNSEGAAGLAFGCALMPVKVLDQDGEGSFFDVAQGVYYAFRDAPRKAKVINLSLGGNVQSRTLSEAIDAAVSAGVIIVASSGNENVRQLSFPASHPRVIAVGAVDARKRRAEYSNYGADLDVVAPGGDVDRDDDGDGRADGVLQQSLDPDLADAGRFDRFVYLRVSGTSQAAPHAAALAALLVHQGITSPAAVQAAMQQTAEDLGASGRDDEHGHGLIRPVEALTGLGLNR